MFILLYLVLLIWRYPMILSVRYVRNCIKERIYILYSVSVPRQISAIAITARVMILKSLIVLRKESPINCWKYKILLRLICTHLSWIPFPIPFPTTIHCCFPVIRRNWKKYKKIWRRKRIKQKES